jgi:phenylpropionate dioxygenase-like ring-hydroxylating dioxygenase large terminal subunit
MLTRTICSAVPIGPTQASTGAPKKVHLHGKEFVLYGNPPRLANDACYHRGASLSSHGRVDVDGCITCGYHGKKSRGRRLKDVDGVLWATDEFEPSEIPRPWELVDPSQRWFTYTESFEGCHPLLLIENTTDFSHLSYVHSFSISADDQTEVEIDDDADIARYIYNTQFGSKRLIVENQFWAPWSTALRFYLDDLHLFSLLFSWVPRSTTHTDLVVRVSRTHWHWTGRLGDAALRIANTLPLIEDRDIVSSIPDHRGWKDDKLCYEDRFLHRYRETMERDYPQIVNHYFS